MGELLSNSIQNAIKSILIIGGFIVLFSVIVSMLDNSKILDILSTIISPILRFLNIPPNYSKSIIIGLIEVTNGLKVLTINQSKASVVICSFLLGFGGLSILFQVLSILSKAKISIKPYIIGKITQGLISAIIMYFIYQ